MMRLNALSRTGWMGLRASVLAVAALSGVATGKAGEPVSSATDVKVLDLALVDQQGLARKLGVEVIGDRIAVVNFIYTSCKTSCPLASAVFGQVQERLGDRLGRDVVLVSLSIDPVTDRPARLRAAAEQFHAKPGWSWLTGDKATVDRVLRGFGIYSSNIVDHPTMVMIGDGKTGEWVRLLGFLGPDDIMAHLERVQLARQNISGPMARPSGKANGLQQGVD